MGDLKSDFDFVRRLALAIVSDTDWSIDPTKSDGDPCPLSRGNARSIIALAELIVETMAVHAGED